jgi:hypothetical protein
MNRQSGAIDGLGFKLLAICFAAWAGLVAYGIQQVTHQLELAHVESAAADQRLTAEIEALGQRLSTVEARQQIVLERLHIDGAR